MNLRVDLILDGERRSASVLNARSLARMAAVIVPCILLVVISSFVAQVIALNTKKSTLVNVWDGQSNKVVKAEQVRIGLTTNTMILSELRGWQTTHVNWNVYLLELQRTIPPQIELRRLAVNHSLLLQDRKFPARSFAISMSGRSVGEGSEDCVQNLKSRLSTSPGFTNLITDVTVPEFKMDSAAGASRSDRVFTVECACRKLLFTAKKP